MRLSAILRGGRVKKTRRDIVNFISSLHADGRIAEATVLVNEAHVLALRRCGAINRSAARKILDALREIERRSLSIRKGEDVHVVIEEFVTRRTGNQTGGLLHLGKSRNDQVATAIRMTLRNEMLNLAQLMLALELCLASLARNNADVAFPGYTHLQPAQPISFGHYLIADCCAFIRDSERLLEAYARVNLSPMGAAALAGTSVPLDRAFVAGLLGFDGTVQVSLDAVGGRDFALEALAVFALIAADLSRVASDLIFYSSMEVGLVTIPDEFASTSSIMPQKKNPDPLELVRAKCGRVAGNFGPAVTVLHGLTSGYNLDYQEITPLLWQSIDELSTCLRILTAILAQTKPAKGISGRSYLRLTAATEIANLLVRYEKIPFRMAHHRVGSLVRKAVAHSKSIQDVSAKDWETAMGFRLRPKTLREIASTLDLKEHLDVYRSAGSPNPRETNRLVTRAEQRIRRLSYEFAQRRGKLEASRYRLMRLASS